MKNNYKTQNKSPKKSPEYLKRLMAIIWFLVKKWLFDMIFEFFE